MKRIICLFLPLAWLGCGYKVVGWSSSEYQTVEVAEIRAEGQNGTHRLAFRLRDALITRFIANSGLRPVKENADLILHTTLLDVTQTTLATATDGRTERLQLAIRASFELVDAAGQRLWYLDNYRYTDQIKVSTTTGNYTNETVQVQELAMKAVADLVVNNVALVISELGKTG